MTTASHFAEYAARLRRFINDQRPPGPSGEAPSLSFDSLALELFRLQFTHNPAYRRFCESRQTTTESVRHWSQIPAMPARAFKELELTSLPAEDRTAVFHSSGTTGQPRSRHFHDAESLATYEASLAPWFERHLLAGVPELLDDLRLGPIDRLPFLALTPTPESAPHSSLVHMFETVRRLFGARDSLFAGRVRGDGGWTVDLDAVLFAIRKSMCANRPIVLLGTAFNFIHVLDHFAANNIRYRLAQGSRVLETGGYKGQSREVPRAELHQLLSRHLGLAPDHIVTEYGMSELSSQAYDVVAGQPGRTGRVFQFPAWCRAQILSPETGREVAMGGTGLIRLFDLANVRSVLAIQTEDLAVRHDDGFELVGRLGEAEPRGCSLMSPAGMVPALP